MRKKIFFSSIINLLLRYPLNLLPRQPHPVNEGIQSAAASANREELAREERRILWGDDLDALRLLMSAWHPPPPGQVGPRGCGLDNH